MPHPYSVGVRTNRLLRTRTSLVQPPDPFWGNCHPCLSSSPPHATMRTTAVRGTWKHLSHKKARSREQPPPARPPQHTQAHTCAGTATAQTQEQPLKGNPKLDTSVPAAPPIKKSRYCQNNPQGVCLHRRNQRRLGSRLAAPGCPHPPSTPPNCPIFATVSGSPMPMMHHLACVGRLLDGAPRLVSVATTPVTGSRPHTSNVSRRPRPPPAACCGHSW